MGSRTEAERSDQCDLNHQLSNFAFLGTSLTGATYEDQDVWITHCGFPAPEFNRAFLKRPGNRDAEAIQTAERFFGDRSLPFKFTCRSNRAGDCASALFGAGFQRDGDTPAMVLPALPATPPKPPAVNGELSVSVVTSEAQLETFQATAMVGFGFPSQVGKIFVTDAFKSLPNVRLYIGSVDGEAVTTSALVATSGVAGIYWVATLEAHRGLGLGAYITMVAACGGADFGCDIASLQASEMGRPVYEKLGFETPYHYTSFVKPGDPAEASAS